MKQLRYGYTLMWREVPDLMRRYGFGEIGSFDKSNGHEGHCWAWPKECRMTNSRAKTIFWQVYLKKSLTVTQTDVLRKALAYSYELCGGEPKGNWKGVKGVADLVRPELLPGRKAKVVPERIPPVKDLKAGFEKEWSPESPWCLVKWSSGLVAAHDCFLNGPRSEEDVDRLKKSRDHVNDFENGWQRTAFKGGRSKLCGAKKGTRAWSLWTGCFCTGGKHRGPPADFYTDLDRYGNPREPGMVTWTTTCPLAALQLLWQLQEEPRRYGKWLDTSKDRRHYFGCSNINDVVSFAIDWFVVQGACPADNRYDHNSGRKCFARLARRLNLEYPAIFQVVGDLQSVWRKSYDPELPHSTYELRDQTADPLLATEAVRMFAKRVLKRGGKFMPRLSRHERFMYSQIKHQQGQE